MTGVIDPTNYERGEDAVEDDSPTWFDDRELTQELTVDTSGPSACTFRKDFPVTVTYGESDRTTTWDLTIEITIDEPVVNTARDIDIQVI